MDNKKNDPRAIALELLVRTEKSGAYSNITLDKALEESELSGADRRLASILFYGVIERKITLDYVISRLSDRDISKIDTNILLALRIGLYQLMYLDRIPPHAAINETVALVQKRSSGFVNAILRSYTRTSGEISFPDKKDSVSYLSVTYSVGKALAKKLIEVFGEDEAEEFLSSLSSAQKTTLRVNTLRTTREALAENIPEAEFSELSDTAIYVKGSPRDIYGFEDGLFFVQDVASQICVRALDAREDQLVMDICACPGSKSFGAAIDMKNKGKLLAFDLHKNKLSLVDSGAKRLGIDIIKSAENDGRNFLPQYESFADRVICDVPCSGFGVLAKKPEIRYKDPSLSERLPEIQSDILNTASKYLKIGGVLVYSTCTIFPEENDLLIEKFLEDHKNFSLVPFFSGELDCPRGMITLLPHKNGCDGFFIAKLIRNN